MDTYFHGEAIITKTKAIPSSAKKIKAKKGNYIIAESEQSGNHHVVLEKEGVEIYEHDGTLFLKNNIDAEVQCVLKERHDSITLEPGIWEIGRANEYDFLKDETVKVAD